MPIHLPLFTAAAALTTSVPRVGSSAAACVSMPRLPQAAMMASTKPRDWTFEDLEMEVKGYLATLDKTALEDPDAPSPLAYLELQSAGRPDLAEGCMKHGGYLAVSNRLNVRIQRKQAAPVGKAPKVPFGGEKIDTAAGVSLSATSKEDKMAADLARLAKASKEKADAPKAAAAPARAVEDRLTPLKVAASLQTEQQRLKNEPKDGPLYGLGRYLRLDGFQRAEALLLVVLIAGGFGRTSTTVIDEGLINVVRLAAEALLVAHVGLAGFGFTLAAGAADQNPVFWAVKLSFTGVGGFAELKRTLDAPAEK